MYLEIIDDQDHQTCGMITPVSLKIANPRLTGLRQRKKRVTFVINLWKKKEENTVLV